MEAMEDLFEARVGLPGCAELHADVGEGVAPGPGADEGVDVEAELVHLRDTGGEGDECADDRQHATYKHSDGAEAGEEMIDTGEGVPAGGGKIAIAFAHG